MGLFKKEMEGEDYYVIYDYDIEDSRNYEEFTEDENLESMRGTIGRGDCMLCGAHNSMHYEGNICFVCSECGESVHEDMYYRWLGK